MQRLLIISNRLPITIEKRNNNIHFHQSTGGLATGLGSFYQQYNSIWIGWPGIVSGRIKKEEWRTAETKLMSQYNCYSVSLSRNDIDKYYNGFSNKTIWPLFHYFNQYVVHDNSFWEAYKRVNAHFSDIVAKITKEGDIIWIHDYHLMLLPQLLRERLPDSTIGYFHHIPFPSFEIFRLLPWRKEILKGLSGADLIGFHTNDYAHHFLASVHRLLGYEYTLSQISTEDRTITACCPNPISKCRD